MRRFLLGFLLALAIAVPATVYAATPSHDQTINGSLTVTGDTFTRSVQASGSSVISNFGDLFAEHLTSAHVSINAGGNGYDWLDGNGNVASRIVAGNFVDPPTLSLPGPALMLNNSASGAQLWFETNPGVWVKVAESR